jgi:hypothetical protein
MNRAFRKGVAAALLAAVLATLVSLAQAETVQRGNLRVSFSGEIQPRTLPRQGAAPIAVSVGGRIYSTDGSPPPQLRRIEIAINRNGRLDPRGLPRCPLAKIQPATTRNALAACRSALVGQGSFAASVAIPEQSPFPSQGKLLAFNGREGGQPVIYAHVYGTDPVPTSFTLPMAITSISKGAFGTSISASLPRVTSNIAFVKEISLTLRRSFSYRGERHGYLSAGCPAPKGFPGAVFPLARAGFAFEGGRTLTTVLTRSCRTTK